MPFCDITIFPVPDGNKESYIAFSRRMAAVYLEYGALAVTDYWQDVTASDDADFHAQDAMQEYADRSLPDFRAFAGAGPGQTVVVSVTQWPDRATRDAAVKRVVVDPRIQATVHERPVFDGRKLIAGGFEML